MDDSNNLFVERSELLEAFHKTEFDEDERDQLLIQLAIHFDEEWNTYANYNDIFHVIDKVLMLDHIHKPAMIRLRKAKAQLKNLLVNQRVRINKTKYAAIV